MLPKQLPVRVTVTRVSASTDNMNNKLIALITSQQERQKEYFLEYLRVQELERFDLEQEHYDDLKIHLDVEQRILSKIVRLSKIIENHIYDLKLKELPESHGILDRQSELETLKEAAIRNNIDNQNALEKRKTQKRPRLVFSVPRKRTPLPVEGALPQIINVSV